MLHEKYEPKSHSEFIGSRQLLGIVKWARAWKKGSAMLIYGPPGCGKSLAAKLAAKELGYELVASHASESRNAAAVKETLLRAAKQRSMFYKGKLLVIDDAEALDSAKAIIELVQKSGFPVLIITSDAYDPKLRALRNYCTLVRFEKIAPDQIEYFLKKVCALENIPMDLRQIRKTAMNCNGDLRAALIDLEAGRSARDSEENIFSVVRKVFKAVSIEAAREAVSNSEESVVPWLEENIPNEYRTPEEIAAAYDYLSKADLFARRITKRQSWTLQKFSYDIAVYGVALSKKSTHAGFTRYQPPRRFYENNSAAEKMAAGLGVSKRRARDYIPLLIALIGKTPSLAEKLSLDEKSLAALRASADPVQRIKAATVN